MMRWETGSKGNMPARVNGTEAICQALESIQRAELEETNDAVILCRSEQELMDSTLEHEVPLVKRMAQREKAIQSLALNLSDGRETLNSLLVAGPDRIAKMREELYRAKQLLLQSQQHAPQGGLAWLRDGLTQGTEELVNMFARNANRPAGV